MKKLNKDQELQLIFKLENVSHSEYPGIWYELNLGRWPSVLGEIPEGISTTGGDLSDFMKMVEDLAGKKACLRYANKKSGMSDQEFDDWWDSYILRDRKMKDKDIGVYRLLNILFFFMGAITYLLISNLI